MVSCVTVGKAERSGVKHSNFWSIRSSAASSVNRQNTYGNWEIHFKNKMSSICVYERKKSLTSEWFFFPNFSGSDKYSQYTYCTGNSAELSVTPCGFHLCKMIFLTCHWDLEVGKNVLWDVVGFKNAISVFTSLLLSQNKKFFNGLYFNLI